MYKWYQMKLFFIERESRGSWGIKILYLLLRLFCRLDDRLADLATPCVTHDAALVYPHDTSAVDSGPHIVHHRLKSGDAARAARASIWFVTRIASA